MVSEFIGVLIILIGLLGLPLTLLIAILVGLDILEIRTMLFANGSVIPGFRSKSTWKAVLGVLEYLSIGSLLLLMIGSALVGLPRWALLIRRQRGDRG